MIGAPCQHPTSYTINRRAGTRRCLTCGYQFTGPAPARRRRADGPVWHFHSGASPVESGARLEMGPAVCQAGMASRTEQEQYVIADWSKVTCGNCHRIRDRILAAQQHARAGALAEIARALDGQEWSPDTLDTIAAILRRAGYVVRDPEDVDAEDLAPAACPECERSHGPNYRGLCTH